MAMVLSLNLPVSRSIGDIAMSSLQTNSPIKFPLQTEFDSQFLYLPNAESFPVVPKSNRKINRLISQQWKRFLKVAERIGSEPSNEAYVAWQTSQEPELVI